jgi:excisionase family DNA binding protein
MRHEEADRNARELGISAPQAALTLGVSVSTIYRWSDLGHLESYRTATGQRRFSQERIDGFISQLHCQHLDPVRDHSTRSTPPTRPQVAQASNRFSKRTRSAGLAYNPAG